MYCVYEANNNIEAHMIKDLLQQQGISAWIEGELLQGGMGELQAVGLVRVVVNNIDQQQAQHIIKQWDAEQPASVSYSTQKTFSFSQGFIVGCLVMLFIMLSL